MGVTKQSLKHLHINNAETHYIDWIECDKNESLADYSKRLIEQIQHPSPIIIGISFGGILAIEIAKLIPIEKVILIASVKTRGELPGYYKLVGNLGLHKLFSGATIKNIAIKGGKFLRVTGIENGSIIKNMLDHTDDVFYKWIIDKIITWKQSTILPNVYHIHGENDKVFPYRNIENPITIKNGAHFMLVNKSKTISEKINTVIYGK